MTTTTTSANVRAQSRTMRSSSVGMVILLLSLMIMVVAVGAEIQDDDDAASTTVQQHNDAHHDQVRVHEAPAGDDHDRHPHSTVVVDHNNAHRLTTTTTTTPNHHHQQQHPSTTDDHQHHDHRPSTTTENHHHQDRRLSTTTQPQYLGVLPDLRHAPASGVNLTATLGRRLPTSKLPDDDVVLLRARWAEVATTVAFTSVVTDPFVERGSIRFLPWSRRHLQRMEDGLHLPIPFWDFSSDAPPALAMEARAHGATLNPLYRPDRRPSSPFPTDTFLALETMAFAQLDYSMLSTQLENLLETVLAALGGDLATVDTAPGDILYWMALANIDRIWWRWSLAHPDADVAPAARRPMKDRAGTFTGDDVLAPVRWDPWGVYDRRNDDGRPQQPTDGHNDDRPDLNVTSGAHVAVAMRTAHIMGNVDQSAFAADKTEQSYQGVVASSGNGTTSGPGLGGLGMTFSDAHEWHTADIPAPNASSATGWSGGGIGGYVPKAGAVSGWDGEAVPPTYNELSQGVFQGNSIPGPTGQTFADGATGDGGVRSTAPGLNGTTNLLPATDGKTFNAIAHNNSHFIDVTPGKGGRPPRVVASVAFSFGGNWGYHNATTPPIFMSQTSALPIRSSATHSLAIQQQTMVGKGDGGKEDEEPTTTVEEVETTTTTTVEEEESMYRTVSEVFTMPPSSHMILSLCEIPITTSSYEVQIIAKNTIIGRIFLEGRGSSKVKFHRDRPVDISQGYKKLLRSVPLQHLNEELKINVINMRLGKQVKTPAFTVRLDQYVF